MTSSERRYRRYKKIRARQQIIDQSGLRGGRLYEKHREKIEKHNGYLSKHGSLLHYARGNNPPSKKTRDRKSYSGTNNWKPKDKAQLESMAADIFEYNQD